MKRLFTKTWAITLGCLLGIGLAVAGLETVTNISDLNTAWPLGSDLASTGDDHMRNIKTALKNDFPNMNGTWNSASAPPFAIPNDTNTGMYGVGADDLGFSTGGTLRFDISTTAATLTLPLTANTITANNLSVTSSTVPANGIYSPSAGAVTLTTGSTNRIAIGSTGAVTVNAPSGAGDVTLTVSSTASTSGTYALQVNGSTTSGTRGAVVKGGTASTSDVSFSAQDSGGTIALFNVSNAASSGSLIQGRGTTAGTLVDMTPDSSTFTYTIATGCTTTPTGTGSWYRIGQQVTLNLGSQTCTSNATGFTITGLPSVIQPAALDQIAAIAASCVENASAAAIGATDIKITHGSGTLTLALGGNAAGFTNSGVKGILTGCVFTYLLK